MKKKFILFVFLISAVANAASSEIDGWIKSETCWVVKNSSKDATIVGIIKYKAACTVEDTEGSFYKIVWAPVREPSTGKFLDNNGRGYFILKKDFTTVLPKNWPRGEPKFLIE